MTRLSKRYRLCICTIGTVELTVITEQSLDTSASAVVHSSMEDSRCTVNVDEFKPPSPVARAGSDEDQGVCRVVSVWGELRYEIEGEAFTRTSYPFEGNGRWLHSSQPGVETEQSVWTSHCYKVNG